MIAKYSTDQRKDHAMQYTFNGKTHGAGCECPKCRTADTKQFIASKLERYTCDLASLSFSNLRPDQARIVDRLVENVNELRLHINA